MPATRKRRTARRDGHPGRARTFLVLVAVAAGAFVIGLLSGLVRPHGLLASSFPPVPTTRSSTHLPPPKAVTEAQPGGVSRRARASHERAQVSSQGTARTSSPFVAARPTARTPSGRPVALLTPPPPQPSAVPDARAAIIIDDCGNNNTPIQAFLDAPAPLTLAILPHLAFSRQIARAAREHDKGVMLHFPMEACSGMDPGPGTIRVAMTDEQKQKVIEDNLASLPDLDGVNNHEGSKATADAHTMSMVLKAVRAQGVFWIDSYTTPDSCAYEVASRLGLPFARRDVFLDNVDEIEPIKEQLRRLIDEARTRGRAIGIGHARVNTATAVVEMIPAFEEAGVKLVLVRDLTSVPHPTQEEKR